MDEELLYGTTALTGGVNSLLVPGNFYLNRIFNNIEEQDTEQIHFDTKNDDIQIAPFVSPLREGKVMTDEGYRAETLKPAYLKPKSVVRAGQSLRRTYNEPLNGNLSSDQRRAAHIIQYLTDHRTYIDRRLEWMGVRAALDGQVTIAGDGYPTRVVDFDRDPNLTKILAGAARWGEAGVSPIADLQSWMDELAEISGAAIDLTIMTFDAWSHVKEDPDFYKMISTDLRNGNSAAELGLKAGVPGAPVFRGRLGDVELYTYQDYYKDEAGTKQALLPPFTVNLVSSGNVMGTQFFGAIHDEHVPDELQASAYVSRSYVTNDPGNRFILTQSAPLLVPKRPNATMGVTVR